MSGVDSPLERLPTFLVIGAMKSGTSSLHDYLGQHPDVFMSGLKELHFFTNRHKRGIKWYGRQFGASGDVRAAGESSTSYLKAHLWPHTAQRIHQLLPDVRLLCLLRNPVDRTLSHYLHSVEKGREIWPFSAAVRADGNIVRTSRYAWQLDSYLQYFRPDQICLTATEDLARDPDAALRRIHRFLGLDDDVRVDTTRRSNVTSAKLASSGRQVPSDPALVVGETGIALTADAREWLTELYRSDVRALRATWPDAPDWGLD